ncbi:hypothetical protein BH10BAC3_BH10BAC3_24300 [soil metagenome]
MFVLLASALFVSQTDTIKKNTNTTRKRCICINFFKEAGASKIPKKTVIFFEKNPLLFKLLLSATQYSPLTTHNLIAPGKFLSADLPLYLPWVRLYLYKGNYASGRNTILN